MQGLVPENTMSQDGNLGHLEDKEDLCKSLVDLLLDRVIELSDDGRLQNPEEDDFSLDTTEYTASLYEAIEKVEKQRKKTEDISNREWYIKSSNAQSPLHQQLRRLVKIGDPMRLAEFLLLNPDINLDVRDHDGNTVLNDIITKNAQFYHIAMLLINAGANIHSRDNLGNSPLHNAVMFYPATEEMIQLLLDNNADVSAKNNSLQVPAQLTASMTLKRALRPKDRFGGGSGDRKMILPDDSPRHSYYKSAIVSPSVRSPGSILKRKAPSTPDVSINDSSINSSLMDDGDLNASSSKRIKFADLDSTGAAIDPEFSDD